MKEEIIVEKFGDFLKKVSGFLTGTGSEPPPTPTVFNSGRVEGGSDPVADSYSAEVMRSALMTTYSKLDSILEAVKQMGGNVEAAKSEISGIVSYIQDAYKKIDEIIKNPRSLPAGERNRTLTDVSKKIAAYTAMGGPIDKWKDKWLGKFNSKLAGSEFFAKGRGLVAKADQLLREVENSKKLKKEIKDQEILDTIRRAKESITGTGGDEEAKPPKPSKAEREKSAAAKKKGPVVFDKANPTSVELLRKRLAKINYKDVGTGQEFTDKDMKAVTQGMGVLGTVTGRTYGNQEADIRQFFDDLGLFVNNRAKFLK